MMKDSLSITYYKNLILSMRLAKLHGVVNIAKPVLLLSIMYNIADGSLQGNRILFTEHLVDTYNRVFITFRDGKITPPIYPYYYLNNEEFYHIQGDTSIKTPSAKFIKEKISYAALDDELWNLLVDKSVREYFQDLIVHKIIQNHSH